MLKVQQLQQNYTIEINFHRTHKKDLCKNDRTFEITFEVKRVLRYLQEILKTLRLIYYYIDNFL